MSGDSSLSSKLKIEQVVQICKDYVRRVFADEQITNLGLEEIEFDPATEHWRVTLGFSRPWDVSPNALMIIGGKADIKRDYKVLIVSDKLASVVSIRNRN
jgi:hypothetical protein